MTADTSASGKLREKTRRALRNRSILYGLMLPPTCWIAGWSVVLLGPFLSNPVEEIGSFIRALYFLLCPLTIIASLSASWVLYRQGSYRLALGASLLPAIYILASIVLGLACNWVSQMSGGAITFGIESSVPLVPDCPSELSPPTGDRIAFMSDRDGHYEIYVMNADGTDQLRLTTSPLAAFYPTWSPDGKTIFFISQVDPNKYLHGDRFMMNADGSGQTRLPDNHEPEATVFWNPSPDGKQIAVVDDENIYVMNADGSGRKQLTDTNYRNRNPRWSPDGSLIAFIASYGGSESPLRSFLYIIRPDGTALTKLMENVGSTPSWSPDGTQIAILAGNSRAIYVINTDSTGSISLPIEFSINAPDWSPDGKWLAFTTPGSDRKEDIAIANSTCAGFWTLTSALGNDVMPTWQPKQER